MVMTALPDTSTSSVQRLALQITQWTKKKNPSQLLAPTSMSNLLSCLHQGVKTITGIDVDLTRAKRIVQKRLNVHVRKQAIPITRRQVFQALELTPKLETRCRIALCWTLGLRSGDPDHLRVRDIRRLSQSAALLRMRGVKGAKPGAEGYYRVVPFSGIGMILRKFLVIAREKAQGLIFQHSTKNHVIQALKRVDPKLSGHSIRRGAATMLASCGASLDEIRIFLGHQSLESTRLYIEPDLEQKCLKKRLKLQSQLC